MWLHAGLARWCLSALTVLVVSAGSTKSTLSAAEPPLLTTKRTPATGDATVVGGPGLVKLGAAESARPEPAAPKSDDTEVEREKLPAVAPKAAKAAKAAEAAPKAVESKTAAGKEPAGRKVTRRCRVTAYCDRGLTAVGVQSGVGQCAAPGDIPLGSVVYIPALDRYFVVTDRTHKRFRHNTVDLFMPTAWECRQFGVRNLSCEFIVCSEPAEYGKLRVSERLAWARR
ncbi:MAG: 3D domain-containing protein [Phycisphaerales bacterium]|nr:3D domain-containing protein [Phycisphaerales bacterium]